MSPERLIVRHFGAMVGTITRASSGALLFAYDSSWVSDGGFALATSLPLQEGTNETS